jgi:streptogramin lyase
MRAITLLVALAALASDATAQQRTIYGAEGKAVARSTTNSQGTVTVYDATSGKAVSREAITGSGTVIYDAQTGRIIARTTREQRR